MVIPNTGRGNQVNLASAVICRGNQMILTVLLQSGCLKLVLVFEFLGCSRCKFTFAWEVRLYILLFSFFYMKKTVISCIDLLGCRSYRRTPQCLYGWPLLSRWLPMVAVLSLLWFGISRIILASHLLRSKKRISNGESEGHREQPNANKQLWCFFLVVMHLYTLYELVGFKTRVA